MFKVYNLIFSALCIHLQNHCHNPDDKHIHHSQNSFMPLCIPSVCSIFSLSSWTSKAFIRTCLESRSGALSLENTIPTFSLFSLWLYPLAQDQETFSLAEGDMGEGSLAFIDHIFSQISGICCEGLSYGNTEASKGLLFSFCP